MTILCTVVYIQVEMLGEPEKSETASSDAALWRVLVRRLGGAAAILHAAFPTAVFAVLAPEAGLLVASVAALGTSLAIVCFQIAMGRTARGALIGAASVGVALLVAWGMGDARGYFVIGIWRSLLAAIAGTVSILMRWPLAGCAWGWLLDHGTHWRSVPPAFLAYVLMTFSGVLANARFVVQQDLYDTDSLSALAAARVLMGWPLGVLLIVIAYPLLRRAHHAMRVAGD